MQKSHSLALVNCKKELQESSDQDALLLERSKQQSSDLRRLIASLRASVDQARNFSDSLKANIQTFRRQATDNTDDHKRQILELVKQSTAVVKDERTINQSYSSKIADLKFSYESFQKNSDERIRQSGVIEEESKQLKQERDSLSERLQQTEDQLEESIEDKNRIKLDAEKTIKQNQFVTEKKFRSKENEWKSKVQQMEKLIAELQAENSKLKQEAKAQQQDRVGQ